MWQKPKRMISLSGGGYRAALYNAGTMRALHFADLLEGPEVVVNAVSGGTITAALWRKYLRSDTSKSPVAWPEESLLDLVTRTPKLGGQFNWQLRGAWFWSSRKWQSFLHKWWDGLGRLPACSQLRHIAGDYEPLILLEALDYNSGRLWLYYRDRFCMASRNYFKSEMDEDKPRCIDLPEMTAVVAATALPILFQGVTATSEENQTDVIRLKDAGLIDNLAMMPLLYLLAKDSSGNSLGNVKQWIISDAGKPLSVISRTPFLNAVGNAQTVTSLGMFDHISRLTGDLAQPQFVMLLGKVLVDYAKINMMQIAIGLSLLDDAPWIPIEDGDLEPSKMSTAICFVSKRMAIRVMTEGAQAMSNALVTTELMTPQKRGEVKAFFSSLERMDSK